MSEPNQNDFEKTAKEQAEVGFFREFWASCATTRSGRCCPFLLC